MIDLRGLAVSCVLGVLLAGCARPPDPFVGTQVHQPAAVSSYVAVDSVPALRAAYDFSPLTGRTIHVNSARDIDLRPGEVVLTFDDGPSPTFTPRILDALDAFHVHAVFMAVGEMAASHPDTLRDVALRGNTVGTHSNHHENLGKETYAQAMASIRDGYEAVAAVLETIGKRPAPFFRFPYLSSTRLLRTSLREDHIVVLDADIDSKDYYKVPAGTVLKATLATLDKKGQGIILMHDTHARTADMLPDLLQALQERGYEVVDLVPDEMGPFGRPIVVAGLEEK